MYLSCPFYQKVTRGFASLNGEKTQRGRKPRRQGKEVAYYIVGFVAAYKTVQNGARKRRCLNSLEIYSSVRVFGDELV